MIHTLGAINATRLHLRLKHRRVKREQECGGQKGEAPLDLIAALGGMDGI